MGVERRGFFFEAFWATYRSKAYQLYKMCISLSLSIYVYTYITVYIYWDICIYTVMWSWFPSQQAELPQQGRNGAAQRNPRGESLGLDVAFATPKDIMVGHLINIKHAEKTWKNYRTCFIKHASHQTSSCFIQTSLHSSFAAAQKDWTAGLQGGAHRGGHGRGAGGVQGGGEGGVETGRRNKKKPTGKWEQMTQIWTTCWVIGLEKMRPVVYICAPRIRMRIAIPIELGILNISKISGDSMSVRLAEKLVRANGVACCIPQDWNRSTSCEQANMRRFASIWMSYWLRQATQEG